MRVWLLHIGEDLPVDGVTRQFRYGYLAQALQNQGHQVLRWAPTFRHNTKTNRFPIDSRVQMSDGYAIQFVHSSGYGRNISIARLQTYRTLDRRFRQLAAQESPPDVIVAAIPSLEWAAAAVDYGRSHGIPVVVDVRDLWPDVFVNALPSPARPLGRVLLAPYFRVARRACRAATALTAVSQTYLEWGLKLAGRRRESRDQIVPIGFEPEPITSSKLQSNLEQLRGRDIDPSRPICLFIGLFERSYDLETVIHAARRLESDGRSDVQFVFCGDGAQRPALQRLAAGLCSVHFLGWVDAMMLQAAASISTIGLCAYSADALQSLPNKPFEYMAGRLAIVSSLPGELAELLNRNRCGVTYRAGDAAALAGAITQILNAPELLSTMRLNAYKTWLRDYRSPEVYSRFVHHLTSLVPATAAAA